jgi:hypothetical protein
MNIIQNKPNQTQFQTRKRLAQLAGREIAMAAFGGLAMPGRTRGPGMWEKLECRISNIEF